MLKVLIADDEPIFIKYMENLIDWKSYGFQICATCRNGREALEQARLKKPDLALVDIEMPVMNGIQFSSSLKEILPEVTIIFITGCADFDYAKKAIKIGAVDFIVKPFDKEELLMTLLKVEKLCRQMHQEQLDKQMLREHFLNQLINNEWTGNDEDALKELVSLDFAVSSPFFLVVSAEIDDMYLKWDSAKEIALWKYAVSNVFSESIEEKHVVFNGPLGRVVALLCFKDEDARNRFDIRNFQNLCDLIKKYFSFTVTIGIGNDVDDLRKIHQSYVESIYALQNKKILKSGGVIEYKNLKSRSDKIGFYSSEINNKLLIGLRMSNCEGVMQNLCEVRRYIEEEQLSLDSVYCIIFGLLSLCLSFVNEMGVSMERVFGKSFSPYQKLTASGSIDASFSYITELYKQALLHASSLEESSRGDSLFWDAKAYIDANFADKNLGIQKVSMNVYVSSRYLSGVFKQKTGMTIGDYIAGIRMQKAKELLVTGGIKLSAVADMVGYSDEGYFCKCFKKHFGMTPGAVACAKP